MNPALVNRPVMSLPISQESEYCELVFVLTLLIIIGCTIVYNLDMEKVGLPPVKHKPQTLFDNPFTVVGFLKRVLTLLVD